MTNKFSIKKIIFVGTRQIGVNCLTHLIETIAGTDTKIVGVLTSGKEPQWWSKECTPDVWQVAEAHQLPLIKEEDLESLEYDMLFCSIYLKIFPKKILDRAKQYNINLHPGPVPNYRGCWGYQHAIINGEAEYGISLHFMDERIDTGNIIEIKKFPIAENDTSKDVYKNTLENGYVLFKKWLPAMLNQELVSVNQQDYAKQHNLVSRCYALNSLKNYFESPQPGLSQLEKSRLIRALNFPPLFTPPAWLTEETENEITK